MKLIVNKKTINEMLISLFLGVCVIFPGDIFNIKKILFFLICLLNLQLLFISLTNKKNGFVSFFGFLFPTFLFLYSSILTSNILSSFARSFSAYIFLLVFIIKYYDINYEKILTKSINFVVFMTLSLVLLDLIGVIDVNTGFFRNNIMYNYDIGLMGKSQEYPFYYKIFFKTSPLIVIQLFRSFDKKKYITTLLSLSALIFSGTRANVIFPIIILFLFYIFFCKNRSKVLKFCFILATISLVCVFSIKIIDTLNEIFIIKGTASDIVRKGHIEGLKQLIKSKPWIVIFGSGMGSSFYSYGVNSYASSIEWSYLDLWRQMGFVFFSLFIVFILLPLFNKNKAGKFKKFAYVSYLLIAATNPLLYSSTSYLFFIYIYYDLYKSNDNLNKYEGDNSEESEYSLSYI